MAIKIIHLGSEFHKITNFLERRSELQEIFYRNEKKKVSGEMKRSSNSRRENRVRLLVGKPRTSDR